MSVNFFRILTFFAFSLIVGGVSSVRTNRTGDKIRIGVGPPRAWTVRARMNKRVSPANFNPPLKFVSGSIFKTKVNVSDRFPRDSARSALNETEAHKLHSPETRGSDGEKASLNVRTRPPCRERPAKVETGDKLPVGESKLNKTNAIKDEGKAENPESADEKGKSGNESGKILVRVGGTVDPSLPADDDAHATKHQPEVKVREKAESPLESKEVEESGGSGNSKASADLKSRAGSKGEEVKEGVGKEAQNETKSGVDSALKTEEVNVRKGGAEAEWENVEYCTTTSAAVKGKAVAKEESVLKRYGHPHGNSSDASSGVKDDLDV